MVLDIALTEVLGSVLLFCLVFGMSATVDIGCLWAQLGNRRAIATGVLLQFVILPFLGFLVVKTLQLNKAMGITLLVVTSSPGGSYSNWWCSMFNADLALSVTMTAISTLLSVVTLPLNLLLHASMAYDDNVIASIDWNGLFVSLAIVISAIGLGLLASYHINSHNFNLHANRLGNTSGILLVIFSAVLSNSDADMQIWDRDWKFFVSVAAPCVLGLVVANIITTGIALHRPERVTVSIECVYQNVGIATSVALTMFDGEELAEAMGVPFYYGVVEAVVLSLYCIVAWKAGWTKAPKDVPLWTAIYTSYEIISVEAAEKQDTQTDAATTTTTTDYMACADPAAPTEEESAELVNAAPVRRQTIVNKGPKEPSYIVPPGGAPA